MPSDDKKKLAVSNAFSSIKRGVRFPHKVLKGPWKDYLFFDEYFMFYPTFIEATNLMIQAEQASTVALINLGSVDPINYDNRPVLFIDQKLSGEDYMSELGKNGWIVWRDSYVCASDKGAWTIYCERQNDVAVLALRQDFPQPVSDLVGKILKANSIKGETTPGDTLMFGFGKLVPEWQSTLVTEYVPLKDEFILDKAFCCPGFQAAVRSAGQRGIAVLTKKTPLGIAFLLQSRGIAFEDVSKNSPNADMPGGKINISSYTGFRYCPWCGTYLEKLVKASPKTFDDLAESHKHLLF